MEAGSAPRGFSCWQVQVESDRVKSRTWIRALLLGSFSVKRMELISQGRPSDQVPMHLDLFFFLKKKAHDEITASPT